VIAELLLTVMKFFQRITGANWGSDHLADAGDEGLTFPLQHKSMKSLRRWQRIQPQLAR